MRYQGLNLLQFSQVSREAYAILEESLAHRNLLRVGQAATRLFSASRVVDKKVFCQIPEGYSIQEVSTPFFYDLLSTLMLGFLH